MMKTSQHSLIKWIGYWEDCIFILPEIHNFVYKDHVVIHGITLYKCIKKGDIGDVFLNINGEHYIYGRISIVQINYG